MKLVEDWKEAYRWVSMWAFVVSMLISTTWLMIPDETKALIPDHWMPVISIVLAVAGAVGRLLDQTWPAPRS